MSRVYYTNEHIQKAFTALYEMEQTMGWNLRCAFPEEEGGYGPLTAVTALAQIVEAAAEVRRLVDAAEAEAVTLFREQAEAVQAIEEGATTEVAPWELPDESVPAGSR